METITREIAIERITERIEAFQRAAAEYRSRRNARTVLSPELCYERARLLRWIKRLAAHGIEIPTTDLYQVGWAYQGRAEEVGYIFETSAELHLPGSRRPTLGEYDNRRTGKPSDRYYFGIYEGAYS